MKENNTENKSNCGLFCESLFINIAVVASIITIIAVFGLVAYDCGMFAWLF